MSRFEEVTEQEYKLMNELIGEHFSYLNIANIHILFDTKKKKIDGKLSAARVQATNELQKYLSIDNDCPDGYDYIVYLDKNLWDILEEPDKKRVLFHELNHFDINPEKETFKTKGHEIEMFESELDYNADDPKWMSRISVILLSIYDKENQ